MKDIFELHLNGEYFEKIKNGTKTFELRVNDVKRKKYEVGNILTFVSRENNSDSFKAEIKSLLYFKSVREAMDQIGKQKFGFSASMTTDKIEDVYLQFYKNEDIEKDGLVAIEVALLS